MREIKFRALQKDRSGITGERWIYWKLGQTPNYIFLDMETAGEFTGLYDKNGKEIYEGDIIQCKWSHFYDKGTKDEFESKNIDTYEVLFYGSGFTIKDNHPIQGGHKLKKPLVYDSGDLFGIINNELKHKYEVIGNIYENPELIGGIK